MTQTGEITVMSVADVPWHDVQLVFGTRGDSSRCWCQYFKPPTPGERQGNSAECQALLHQQIVKNDPAPGLIAYLGEEPVGWCAVEPRRNYPRLLRHALVTEGSPDPADDASVWSVSCFVVRVGFRRRGVAGALLAAAVEHARRHGARLLEAYPVDVAARPGASAADLYHGTLSQFLAAGFHEVSRPKPDRPVVHLTLRG